MHGGFTDKIPGLDIQGVRENKIPVGQNEMVFGSRGRESGGGFWGLAMEVRLRLRFRSGSRFLEKEVLGEGKWRFWIQVIWS